MVSECELICMLVPGVVPWLYLFRVEPGVSVQVCGLVYRILLIPAFLLHHFQ